MSRELERKALQHFFKDTAWSSSYGPPENIAWPNKSFETPKAALFVVYNHVDRGSQRITLGRTYKKRIFSAVQVDIYTPIDLGTKLSREMADSWELLYDMQEIVLSDGEMCRFQTPSSRVLDPNVIRAANLDDNWDRYVFEAPYYRDVHVSK